METSNQFQTEDKKFIPFRKRKSHWGEQETRYAIPNIATVLPPNLPEPILKALLLRMQIEELHFKLRNKDQFINILWRENSIDTTNWEKIDDALEGRAKEAAGAEIRAIVKEIDEMFPPSSTTILSPNNAT
ncbi:hypothetical protein GPJ56_002934 [Histomonas meleagridis]|uniref:uncharacterized protein n=1 Tax=Histomonas meleagridis TaxID=135588 RepID=UPI00355AA14B|nr:hypothetical protein GPJ56_002934 [Histomonas meleagridis]KAH0800366.1 hypothetical protein GO595_006777 [Histomonas meleagridis]